MSTLPSGVIKVNAKKKEGREDGEVLKL